jgi:hypothetical protein
MLPAQAAWALEAERPRDHLRRSTRWWLSAAVGHWFANGALFVTPACALLLFAVTWRRHGPRAAFVFALVGTIWLASFAAHYQWSLQYTHHSSFLRPYWESQLPAASAGLIGTGRWVIDRLEPFAQNPAGTALWAGLWLSAFCGFALGARPALGAVFATVPLSAVVLASLRLVPLHQRFSLWVVPALYLGLVLAVDGAVRQARLAVARRRWARFALSLTLALVGLRVSADIVRRGRDDLDLVRPATKHGLDDRAAVRWLMQQRRPGDAVMTTRLGWPAVWWYAGMSIADPTAVGARQADGSAMYEMAHLPPGPGCRQDQLSEVLRDHPRVLVYLGFRDVPPGFESLLLRALKSLGDVSDYAEFSTSLAAVVDLRGGVANESRSQAPPAAAGAGDLDGCIGAQAAHRW